MNEIKLTRRTTCNCMCPKHCSDENQTTIDANLFKQNCALNKELEIYKKALELAALCDKRGSQYWLDKAKEVKA